MTTAIALETSKGDLPLAIGLGIVLIAIVIAVNALAWIARRAGERLAGMTMRAPASSELPIVFDGVTRDGRRTSRSSIVSRSRSAPGPPTVLIGPERCRQDHAAARWRWG